MVSVQDFFKKHEEKVVDCVPQSTELSSVSKPLSSPSQSAAEALPVKVERSSMVDGLAKVFGGGKATNDQNVHELVTIDDNIGMKTVTKDPIAQMLLGVLWREAERDDLPDVAQTMRDVERLIDVRFASDGGRQSDMVAEIYRNRHQEDVVNPDMQEKFEGLGKRGKR